MGGRENDPMTFKRNLHCFGIPLLIDGGSECPFVRQPRGSNATLLPVILKLGIYIPIPDFKWQFSKR
jgi:hypothetical protein